MKHFLCTIVLTAVVAGCNPAPEPVTDTETSVPKHDRDAAWTPPGGLPPFAERQDPNPGTGSWINRLEPQPSDACTFTAKPASERPEGLILTAWSGNLDLLTPHDTLAHDHATGFVEAHFMNEGPVVAVRDGMDDLWIEPVGDDVVLYIGADELTCRRATAD